MVLKADLGGGQKSTTTRLIKPNLLQITLKTVATWSIATVILISSWFSLRRAGDTLEGELRE